MRYLFASVPTRENLLCGEANRPAQANPAQSAYFLMFEIANDRKMPMQPNSPALTFQTELANLRQRLSSAGQQHDLSQMAALMEENERLVLAALTSEQTATKAVNDLMRLTWSSQRDPLTKTPNRTLMFERLQRAITMAKRRSTRLAVLFVDIDKFKLINDTLGHAAGDKVLQLVSCCLESVVRESDTVSRHGGDEFLVLLDDLSQSAGAGLLAEKMSQAITAQSSLDEQTKNLSVSIGIAIFPEDGTDATTLISRADEAMYRCKGTPLRHAFYGDAPPTP